MKRLLMTAGMFIAAFALSVMTAQAETATFRKVIEVRGADKEQVMEKVSAWADMYGRSCNKDTKDGIVTVNGEITYPSPPVDRIQYSILFEMKNRIVGNRNEVTFDKVMLKSPTQYVSNGPPIAGQTYPLTSGAVTRKDMAAVNNRLTYVSDNLGAYLLSRTDTSNPLMKCPDCAALCTSPGEMKEHMKSHELMNVQPGHENMPKY